MYVAVILDSIFDFINIIFIYLSVKAAPWDDINFRFYLRNEVVYPTDHSFFFFLEFLYFYKYFLSTFL